MRRWIISLLILLMMFSIAEAKRRRHRRTTASGKLEISSMTEGATVFIDGKLVGNIPLPAPINLPVGKHTLKITKEGYTEYLDVVTIKRRKTASVDIDLLPFAGIIYITSSVESARVFIDGEFAGVTPLKKEVLIGKRKIKVTKAGYYDYFGEFQSIAGNSKRLHIRLKLMPVGSTPYRPPPPPPPKWYEKWYIWAAAAGGVAAITLAIVIPVVVMNKDEVSEFCSSADFCWNTR